MPAGHFGDGFMGAWHGLWQVSPDRPRWLPIRWLQFHFLPLAYLLVLTAVAIWLFWKKERLLSLTTFSLLLISHNQAFWRSVVRYDLPLIPLAALPLLMVAARAKGPMRQTMLYSIFGLLCLAQLYLQITFGRLFQTGHWAF